MKYIRTKNLIPGMLTASNLYDSASHLLLRANAVLTKALIRRLANLGFHGIYVLHDKEDDAYRPLLDDASRLEAIKSLRGLDVDQIRYVANNVTNSVLADSRRLYDMMAVCSYDALTYQHSVNVCVLSVMMGVSMGLGNAQLLELGEAALLHDVGKTQVDPAIIKKPGRLTPEEMAQVRMHPLFGYETLKENAGIPESVRQAVLSHHENEDGSGYPNAIASQDIPLYAKAIHVADVYDAMASRRVYKERMNPADVLEHLYANTGSLYDLKCVMALKSSVALYPDGVLVRLSDGVKAWVQENFRGFPSRPLVLTESGLRLNLMRRLDLTVTAVLEG